MKNVVALTGMLLMILLTSATLGAERDIDLYEVSSPKGLAPIDGILKNQNDCPTGTKFFKNVAPALTNGPGGTCELTPPEFRGEILSIDGTEVTFSVCWDDDNSVDFQVQGGVAHLVGVTSDTNNLLYDYVNFLNFREQSPESDLPVFSDGELNKIESAADVNHLDLCLALVDTTDPIITFISPVEGDTVSGTVTVIVTVEEESGFAAGYPQVSVTDEDDVPVLDDPVEMTCTQLSSNQYECIYDWRTADLEPGSYTITVEAIDGAVPDQNLATSSITVNRFNLLSDCYGVLGDEDFTGNPDPDGFANGCEPTPLANVQAPPDSGICNAQNNPPPECFIAGRQLKPNRSEYAIAAAAYGFEGRCDACAENYCGDIAAGEYGIPDPRMYCDGTFTFDSQTGEGGCEGSWVPNSALLSLAVKHVTEGDTELVLGKYVYGHNGCFAASQHVRGGASIEDLYDYWPKEPPTGLVFIKTHRPANVIPSELVALCSNIGQQDVSQAGYQPIEKDQSVDRLEVGTPAITLAATQECFNPPRTLSRDNGIDVSNIIETDGSDDPVAFKYQRAQVQFDALFTALDCAEPTFIRRGKSRFSKVSSPINQAKAQFDNGTIAALGRARDDLEDAASAIRTSNWGVTADNCAGDALARTENLAWRMTDLLAALGVPPAL